MECILRTEANAPSRLKRKRLLIFLFILFYSFSGLASLIVDGVGKRGGGVERAVVMSLFSSLIFSSQGKILCAVSSFLYTNTRQFA